MFADVTLISIILVVAVACCQHQPSRPASNANGLSRLDSAKWRKEQKSGVRGRAFEELVVELDGLTKEGNSIVLPQIVALLGQPDFKFSDAQGTTYFYLYNRFGDRDWFVVMAMNPADKLIQVGFNAAEALDMTKLQSK